LHQRFPGYVFSELRPVELLHESGRLELWTTGSGAYQGRRCGSCARWSHRSDADVP
jgi:hypothetical protein